MALSAFHDVRFPLALAFGATGGPERRNEIVQLQSGHERRNARFSGSRRCFDAGSGVRSLSDLYELMAFFEARRGSLHAFRFRDPFDMKSCAPDGVVRATDQTIGTGTGTEARFALAKTYGTGPDAVRRVITKPVPGTVRIAVAGVEKSGAAFTLDASAGEIVFAAGHVPLAGQAVTAGFEFDVPVRFDTERLEASLTAFKAGQVPAVPLVEVLA
ncbi:MAG: DUF2460 domain-containing protein [Methylobacterium mesophilicum]|nr:DUF2460 domain-containing protein [Methylobacterium mesophilicum]